jgi:predicted dehydrogenase
VEDEATIVVGYPKAQLIIQASWNWPFDRKDMEIYGKTGYVLVPQSDLLRVRTAKMSSETEMTPPPITGANADPVSYLAAVVRREIKPAGLSSLAVNLVVMEILDAAQESARTGKRIQF